MKMFLKTLAKNKELNNNPLIQKMTVKLPKTNLTKIKENFDIILLFPPNILVFSLLSFLNQEGCSSSEVSSRLNVLYLNGFKHGKATVITSTKNKFVGEYEKDNFVKGIIYYDGGNIAKGEWDENFKQQGKGEFIWSSGTKYVGDFKDDKLSGVGEFFYSNGNKYKGDVLDTKRHGVGTP